MTIFCRPLSIIALRIIFFATVTFALSGMLPATSFAENCTQHDAQKAETEASSLHTWPQLFDSYRRYRSCDDGAISEGYSSSVAALLAFHWDRIADVLPLIRSDSGFRRFVLRHVDDTMSKDQDTKIQSNVRDQCPTAAAHFCADIRKRFAFLDSEQSQLPKPN
jgi:hypothetical protein